MLSAIYGIEIDLIITHFIYAAMYLYPYVLMNTRIRVWSNESTLILFLSPVEFPTIPGHLKRP